MNEQTTTATEPVTTTLDPLVTDTPVVEPLRVEEATAQAPTELVSVFETAQTEPISEPIKTPTETPTPQMAGNEPLLESVPEPTQPSAGATAEAPQRETPTIASTPNFEAGTPEETPPKAEEIVCCEDFCMDRIGVASVFDTIKMNI